MDKFDFSCGYCKKLECGGSISSEKTFYTVFDKLLCGLTNDLTDCISPQRSLPNTSFRVPTQEEMDGFISVWGGLDPFTEVLPANLPIGFFDLVPLPPGKTDGWRVAVFDVEIDSNECEDIYLYGPSFVSSLGPDNIPIDPLNPNGGFGGIILVDAAYTGVFGLNVLGNPLAINDWRPFSLFGGPLSPGSYKVFLTIVTNSGSVSGPWSCRYRYGVSNVFTFSAGEFLPTIPSNICPPKALSASLCQVPKTLNYWKETILQLCDANDVRFLRHYGYDIHGTLGVIFDTDIDGNRINTTEPISTCS